MFYLWEDTFDDSFFCDEVFCWKYRDFLQIFDESIRQMLDTGDAVECVTEKLETDDGLTR